MCPVLLAVLLGDLPPSAADVVVSGFGGKAVERTADFAIGRSPYALGGTYLWARSPGRAAKPGWIRVRAPAGEYHVYVAWMRHRRGAKAVRIRVADAEAEVDQSRLANGLSPDDCARDDMKEYKGVCTSGLFRLTDRPVKLRKGDAVEIMRSDAAADVVTSLDYVVFSPFLYLDDLGSDAKAAGRPMINLRDYRRPAAGGSSKAGLGLAFLAPGQPDAAIEWTLPAEGLFVLSADPNRGPNRAEAMPLEIELPEGRVVARPMAGKSRDFGRRGWQHLGVLRAGRGAKLRVRAAREGFVSPDLLRLTPIAPADLDPPGKARCDTFTVQWEAPSERRPWLRSVRVVCPEARKVSVTAIGPEAGLPHGRRVRVPRRKLPVLGAKDGGGLSIPGSGVFRVELAGDYGFTLSGALLRREPFVWLKDLGIFACADGDFASKKAGVEALAARVAAARKEPFRSTSEKYFAFTGYDETRRGLDDRAFEFAYAEARPPGPRVSESLARMPEADYRYFRERIPDVRHRRMFLGWPNVCQEFYVLSNGCLGVSSGSGWGTGHPPAEAFTVAFGAGDPPAFRRHGDASVAQSLEGGYHIVVHTKWREGETAVHTTALAYPLVGEDVRTGNEPLAAFVRVRRTGGGPLWLRIRPDHWGGKPNRLKGLAKARIDKGRLLAGERTVLAFDHAAAAIASATPGRVLVKITPRRGHVDLVIPYVAVDDKLIADARKLGFEAALSRTIRYWDARLAKGAAVSVPDAVVVNQYKTLYPRTLVTGDLDTEGDYALKTSPIVYDRVWLHATAYGIEGLCRRGHFAEARQYLEAGFRWQGSQRGDASKAYTAWAGFFTAPPRYTALLWMNYHGWFQWAAARYFLFSDDRKWLDAKLPALIKSLEWTVSQRKLTMGRGPAASRPIGYGWLPPGRVTDGSAGTSTFTDCINWMGFREVVRVLERVRHRRAAEFRRVADDYRRCVLRGLRLAARLREPVRLNDGTFVPYVPGYLESKGHEADMWYAAVVDGGLEGVLDSGIVPPGSARAKPGEPLEDWVLSNLEDNLFVMAPNLADEGHFVGHGCAYLRRDQPKHAIYTFYSLLATQMARQTLTTYEHRSWGAGRVYDLAPWPMGYYTRMLAGMLCYDEGGELIYGRATPRAWLDPGKEIRIERLQTRFGPTSFHLSATARRIRGRIDLPTRYRPRAASLRLRLHGRLQHVRLNGRPANFDPGSGTVLLPVDPDTIDLDATVSR